MKHALTGDGPWQRVIIKKISTAQNLCAHGLPMILIGLDNYMEYEMQAQTIS